VVRAPVPLGRCRRTLALTGAALLAAVAACGGDDGTRAERFCDRLREDQSVLSGLPPTPDGMDQVVEAYTNVGEVAPLAVEEDWGVITSVVTAAAEVDPDDPVAVEQVRANALAASQAILRVTAYANETCGVSLSGLAVPSTPVTLPDGSTVPPTTPAPGTLPVPSG
jgi:hypothetical protein